MTSVTIGLPVSDLAQATRWYQEVFALADPDLTPAPGVLEFQVGPVWLQLTEGPPGSAAAGAAGPVTRFDFTDPDGNRLSLHSMAGH